MVTAKKPRAASDVRAQAAERRAELADARAERALTALSAMLALVSRVGGYLSPEQMQTVWDARAALAEAGRRSGGEQ